MKALNSVHPGDFHQIRLNMTEAEARCVRRALILGLQVMAQQISDRSPDFKAGSYVCAEQAVCELAEAIDKPYIEANQCQTK